MALRTLTPLRRVLVLAVVTGLGLVTVAAGPVSARPAPDRSAEPAAAGYRVLGPRTFADRNAVARTGAAIDYSEHGVLHVSATTAEAAAIGRLGFRLEPLAPPPAAAPDAGDVGTLAFPPAGSPARRRATTTSTAA